MFPTNTAINVVQGADGLLYGGVTTGSPPKQFYYSMRLDGSGFQQYPMPGTWGSGFNTTVSPPDGIYDLVAEPVGDQVGYGFARVTESGKVTVLHQFSTSDGVPDAYANMVLGPDATSTVSAPSRPMASARCSSFVSHPRAITRFC